MSLDSWKKEFYPIDADDVKIEDACDHSIKKWEGLRKENLAKHDVYVTGCVIEDKTGDYMLISSSSCALCRYFEHTGGKHGCQKCPLYEALDFHRCDDKRSTDPYGEWFDSRNPESMIKYLYEVKELYDKRRASGNVS